MQVRDWFRLVRFSHTVFALPFAAVGYGLGVRTIGDFVPLTLILVLLCMVTNRNAAMAFNRLVDARYDALNPRTAGREIPRRVISRRAATLFVVVNSLLFIGCAYALQPITGYLAPIALAIVLVYSLTKRFTWLCHYVLGCGLGLAPIGAYLAVSGVFSFATLFLGLGVLFWVAGFDVVYALQDEAFDRAHRLFSLPSRFGARRAAHIAQLTHLVAVGCFGIAVVLLSLGGWGYLAWGLFTLILAGQHLHLYRSRYAFTPRFMLVNGCNSLLFGGLLCLGVLAL